MKRQGSERTVVNELARHQRHRRRAPSVALAPAARDDIARARLLAVVVLAVAFVLALAPARDARAGLYKWVDERGAVHYSDKIPAEAVNRGNTELDRQGRTVRKTAAALTPEQVRARNEEVLRQRQLAKEREETDRRDRALIATYARESDIDLARARALGTIDSQLQSARVYAGQLTKRRKELVDKPRSPGAGAVPPAAERELEGIDSELAKTNALIEARTQESMAVAAKYDADRQRYRELLARATADAAAAKAESQRAGDLGIVPAKIVPTGSAR
jgi:hypothetical protein